MSTVDTIVCVVCGFGFLYGLRRGFFREVIGLVAIVAAVWAGTNASPALGAGFAQRFSMSPTMGVITAGCLAAVATYVVVLVVGLLVFKWLMRSPADRIAQAVGADGAAEQGAVSVALKVLPTRRSILYVIDKVLGAFLGVAKAAAYSAVALVGLASMNLGTWSEAARASAAYAAYNTHIAAHVEAIPEVRLVKRLPGWTQLAKQVGDNPQLARDLFDGPEFGPIREYEPLQAVIDSERVRELWDRQAFAELVDVPEVKTLFSDRKLLHLIADVDVQRLLREAQLRGTGQ